MVLAKIRELPGSPPWAAPETGELLSQAAGGPIVSFVISRYGSYALLLTSTEIAALQLPALTFDAVINQVNAFHHALDEATDSRADPAKAQATLGDILAWLWDTAAGPVLDALRITQAPDGPVWPRVWWAHGGLRASSRCTPLATTRTDAMTALGAPSWTASCPPTPPRSAPSATPAATSRRTRARTPTGLPRRQHRTGR